MKSINNVIIKTGSTEDFFDKIRGVMKNLDKGIIPESSHVITFEDQTEMLSFINERNIELQAF